MRDIPMHDNSDIQSLIDGKITDMRIENLLDCLIHGRWREPDLDRLFNEIVREFVHPSAPALKVSKLGSFDGNTALSYLLLLKLEFSITYPGCLQWPGDFEYMPDAVCAMSIFYPLRKGESTDYIGGRNLSHAAVCAIVQFAREQSLEIYNQGKLFLN